MCTHHGDEAPLSNLLGPLPNHFSSIKNRPFRRTITLLERQIVAQGLLDAETDVNSYQAEIDRLKATIMVLETRRDGLKEKMTKYRSLLSPIHRLPPELLGRIFVFFCNKPNCITPIRPPAAITLSSVCGRWREHATELPRLWSSMTIPLHAWKNEDTGTWHSQEFHRCVELFVKRSKEEPLNLEFCEIFDEPFKPLEAGLLCILKSSSRWRRLAFPDAFRHMNFIPPFFRSLRGGLPNLQHLTLDYDDSEDDEEFLPFDMARFNDCSSLNSLEFRAQFLPWVPGFPWAQIQSLDLERCRFSDIVKTMPLSKDVRKLRLEDLVMDVSSNSGPVTVLNNIHLLSIHAHHDISSLFFQFFSLPALSSLVICASHYGHLEWNPGAFVDSLLRSSCSLTSLTLRWLVLPDKESLYRLLVLIPTIVTLSIEEHTFTYYGGPPRPRNMIVTPQFLEDLVVSAGNESSVSFLPRLSELILIICPLEPSSRLKLSRVLASRTPVLRSFDLVVKNLEAEADVSDYETLRCFRGVGIRVRISCPVELNSTRS